MSEKVTKVVFRPRARLLLQLGDQLIKNESIALIELVKNSYDADANKVDVYMENADNPAEGIIIIEDDGFGMNQEIVETVWMEPGSDFKANQFLKKEVTQKYKRLPIGEKGIGRFGVHKLGNQIELITKRENCKEVYVKIDWATFNNYRYLEEVPISIVERETPQHFKGGKTGTSIVISDLRKTWTRSVARNVKRTLTTLTSPFQSNDSFRTEFHVVDKPDWFTGLLEWKDVNEYSLFKFKISIRGNSIQSFEYAFTPWESMPKLSGRHLLDTPTDSNLAPTEKNFLETFRELADPNEKPISLNGHDIGEIIFEGFIFDRDPLVSAEVVASKSLVIQNFFIMLPPFVYPFSSRAS